MFTRVTSALYSTHKSAHIDENMLGEDYMYFFSPCIRCPAVRVVPSRCAHRPCAHTSSSGAQQKAARSGDHRGNERREGRLERWRQKAGHLHAQHQRVEP